MSNLDRGFVDQLEEPAIKRLGIQYKEGKAPVPLSRIPFRLITIMNNFVIANNLKPIGMIEFYCVTTYLNIYECVCDDLKIHHYRFRTFTETL